MNLQHANEDCLDKCNKLEGKCDWCGTDGWCCAKNQIGSGCDGTFGGDPGHQCVLKPLKPPSNTYLHRKY